ncbi:MAG: glycosyltransferase [Oscillospiraceae bacterium]|jgi:glycosyltransferase involved in cell wall biosynthesis|nr:glycosyltransferase [Oscillospiraceae bacterium]
MKKIAVLTQAYNAESTLPHAMDSVLAQSYPHLIYFLLDSASTDGTWRVINEYARRDSRVVLLRNTFNRLSAYIDRIPEIADAAGKDGLFAMLDADDAYHTDAFEKMLGFMNDRRLDISSCGARHISVTTGRAMKSGVHEGDTVYERERFGYYYPEYWQVMSTVWGKLFSCATLMKCDFTTARSFTIGADTAFTLEAVKHTERFGILEEALYDYYIYPNSILRRFDDSRAGDGRNYYETAFDFLNAVNGLSDYNKTFMMQVYFDIIRNSVGMTRDARINPSRVMRCLKTIFTDPLTREALMSDGISMSEKVDLITEVF